MQSEIFDAIYRNEKTNWWFVARRHLVHQAILRALAAGKSSRLRLLDIGCGTGAMLDECAPLGTVVGTDLSPVALQFCRQRGLHRILFADGTRLPFANGSFGAIISMDVIEHIEDDASVLRECYRVCAPGGVTVITVPALRWLWTTRDERLAHKRRYHRAELVRVAEQAGWQVAKCSYYVVSFLPVVALIVWLQRLFSSKPTIKTEVLSLPRWVNRLCLLVVVAEQWLMRWVNYPLGVSLFCVCRKGATTLSDIKIPGRRRSAEAN